MPQEYIEIRGARENNLKNVSLRIPKRNITIFTGVSGSGKSSIVFDTLAAEARRQLNDTFSTFVRTFLPRYAQPDADAIENLSMAIVVDQKRMGGGSHSTVGTITDIYTVLRLLYSRIGKPFVGNYNVFSFNDPQGKCPECNGLGRKIGVDLDAFLDTSRSLNEGAILYPEYAVNSWGWSNFLNASGLFDMDKKLADYTDQEMELLLHSKPQKVKVQFGGKMVNLTFEGIVDKFTRKYIAPAKFTPSERTLKTVAPYMTFGPCSLCKGTRLSPAALSSKINGRNIAEMSAMEVDELIDVIRAIKAPEAAPIVATLTERLQYLIDIGLEYLSLNRETDTLSGGESQRIKMVKHLGSSLVDVMYVFDEPSIGLHPRDVHRLNELLRKLRDKGNTVIVVEHDRDVIKAADHVVDVGPLAGVNGGQIVFEGSYDQLLKADTLTAKHLQGQLPMKTRFRTPTGALPVVDAHANNLQHIDLDIPTGVFTVITGVAGSGKSSLIHQAFATANKVHAGLFSFNSKGACEGCNGAGVITTDLGFLGEAKLVCDVCEGRRFKDEVLGYKYRDASILDVLNMTVAQAIDFFDIKEIARKLAAMGDVGLDYLTLGQPFNTLSGGECQRMKLASELHKKGNVYVLDEPTTGLHMSDIARLRQLIDRLVDEGNTIITIEHNLDIIRSADWVIDLGPEGGNKGGRIIFEGTPAQLAKSKRSLIAGYL